MRRIGWPRFWSKCLKPIRARIRRASPMLARRGGAPRTWRGRRSPLLRRQSGLLDHAPGGDAILDEEAGKLLRRVQDRLQRAIDELFLAEGELVADAASSRILLITALGVAGGAGRAK